jgi:tRNA nucleotidyltransferase (CCA-adding enzyme)
MTKVLQFAERIKEEGGRALLVGGCVRDEILGRANKDIDIECYGIQPDKLQEIVGEFGKVDAVGASFQVYKLGQEIDVSLPRRERKTGVGHKGFTVEGDPFMSYEEACSRRDFTINSIMKDPLTGEIIDPFNGKKDLQDKTIRMVSPKTFQEDSLRVFRLIQFASRFGFDVDFLTFEFAKKADLSDLPKERIWMELEKMFLKSAKPSVGVSLLFQLHIKFKLFPSLKSYCGFTKKIDKAVQFSNDLSDGEKLVLLLCALTWNSELDVLDELGVSSVDGYNVREKVEQLITHSYCNLDSDYDYHKLSQKLDMKLFGRILYIFSSKKAEEVNNTIERLDIIDKPLSPILMGRHLIEMGFEPSPKFSEVIGEVYEEQLKGGIKDLREAKVYGKALMLNMGE